MEPKRILTPKIDLIFKIVFGSEQNIDILTSFLQAALDLPAEEYDSITLANPYLSPESLIGKTAILDIKIKTTTGKVIGVEMQVQSIPEMRERLVFYASKMIAEQALRGDEYSVIQKVISIVIADFVLISENDFYHNRYHLHDPQTGSTFTDIVEIHTLELPKIPQDGDAPLLNWLRLFNADNEEELKELAERSEEMRKTVAIIEQLSEDEKMQRLAEAAEKNRRDEASRLQGAYREGREEGREEVARNMLEEGLSDELIARVTGLPLAEIEKLRAQ